MPVLAYDEVDKPFLSLPACAAAACIALVLGLGAGVLLTGRSDPASARPAAPTPVGCPAAMAGAAAALAEAKQVSDALATQTQVMNDLMAHRISADQAVQRVAPALTSGAQHSVGLDVATQRYHAAAAQCRP